MTVQWIESDDGSLREVYQPTRIAIFLACRKFQRGWSPKERERRRKLLQPTEADLPPKTHGRKFTVVNEDVMEVPV